MNFKDYSLVVWYFQDFKTFRGAFRGGNNFFVVQKLSIDIIDVLFSLYLE